MNNTTAKSSYKPKVEYLALTGMFAALVAVTTAYIKIPSLLGYTHAGDSMIYLAACILPAPYSFAAASIGGALADIIAGYPHWAIPTAIIKALNVVPFFIMRHYLKKKDKDDKVLNLHTLLMILPTSAVTIFGYLIANTLMYDWSSAIAELPTCWIQPSVGAIIFIAFGIALDKMNFKSRLKL